MGLKKGFFVLIFAVFLLNFILLYHGGIDSLKFQQNCAGVRSIHPIKTESSLCG